MVVVALLVVAQVVALVVVESVAVLVQRRRPAGLPRRLLALPRPQHFLLESYPFSNPGHDAGHAGRLHARHKNVKVELGVFAHWLCTMTVHIDCAGQLHSSHKREGAGATCAWLVPCGLPSPGCLVVSRSVGPTDRPTCRRPHAMGLAMGLAMDLAIDQLRANRVIVRRAVRGLAAVAGLVAAAIIRNHPVRQSRGGRLSCRSCICAMGRTMAREEVVPLLCWVVEVPRRH